MGVCKVQLPLFKVMLVGVGICLASLFLAPFSILHFSQRGGQSDAMTHFLAQQQLQSKPAVSVLPAIQLGADDAWHDLREENQQGQGDNSRLQAPASVQVGLQARKEKGERFMRTVAGGAEQQAAPEDSSQDEQEGSDDVEQAEEDGEQEAERASGTAQAADTALSPADSSSQEGSKEEEERQQQAGSSATKPLLLSEDTPPELLQKLSKGIRSACPGTFCLFFHVISSCECVAAFNATLSDLLAADYSSYGSSIPVIIHVNYSPLQTVCSAVRATAGAFKRQWTHGNVYFDIRFSRTYSSRSMVLSAWPLQSLHYMDQALIIEEGTRLSPCFMSWLYLAVQTYGHPYAGFRDVLLMSISLTPMLYDVRDTAGQGAQAAAAGGGGSGVAGQGGVAGPADRELQQDPSSASSSSSSSASSSPYRYVDPSTGLPVGRPFNARPVLQERESHPPTYLHAIPSGSASLFFADKWEAFLRFYQQRMQEPLYSMQQEEEAVRGVLQQEGAAAAGAGAAAGTAAGAAGAGGSPLVPGGAQRRPIPVQAGDPSLALPGLTTNLWSQSWLRYLQEFSYGRGYYTMYFHVMEGAAALAQPPLRYGTLVSAVEHWSGGGEMLSAGAGQAGELPAPAAGAGSQSSAPVTSPAGQQGQMQQQEVSLFLHLASAAQLPAAVSPLDRLTLIDWRGEKKVRKLLLEEGDAFLRRLSAKGGAYEALVDLWGRSCLLDVRQEEEAVKAAAEAGSDPHAKLSSPNLRGSTSSSSSSTTSSESQSGSSELSPAAAAFLSDGKRYLLYQPQMGLNNQLLAVAAAATWAQALGRVLVLPHLFHPRVSASIGEPAEQWIPFDKLFDPSDVQDILPGLQTVVADVQTLRSWPKPARIARVEPPAVFDSLSDGYFHALDWSNKTMKVLDLEKDKQALLSSGATLQAYLGTCKDKVLAANGLFKGRLFSVPMSSFSTLFQRFTRPQGNVLEIVDRAEDMVRGKSSDGTFSCLHIRLGDFSPLCASSPESRTWLASLYASGKHCAITDQMLLSAIENSKADTLLLISDDTATVRKVLQGNTSALVKSKNIFTGDDLLPLVEEGLQQVAGQAKTLSPSFKQLLSAVVEQHSCARADELWINGFSTFSVGISRIRDGDKKGGLHFW